MAFESFNALDVSLPAASDLTSSGSVNPQFCAVLLGSGGVAFATAAGNITGILQDKGASAANRATAVRTVPGTVTKALAGGTGWTAGANLEVVGAVGALQTKVAGVIVAQGVDATSAGSYGTVILKQGQSA